MIRARDPAEMTPAERLAEIATILATGYGRLRITRQKETDSAQTLLAESAHPERPCGSRATSPKSNEDVA